MVGFGRVGGEEVRGSCVADVVINAASEFAKKRIEELRQKVGEDALRAGPERTETGARAPQGRMRPFQVLVGGA